MTFSHSTPLMGRNTTKTFLLLSNLTGLHSYNRIDETEVHVLIQTVFTYQHVAIS